MLLFERLARGHNPIAAKRITTTTPGPHQAGLFI